uniref:Putative secreted protein n=1 Tax=Anopheles darlingi TaxID=43151 RepID=A0A2M4DPZ3_ANODA
MCRFGRSLALFRKALAVLQRLPLCTVPCATLNPIYSSLLTSISSGIPNSKAASVITSLVNSFAMNEFTFSSPPFAW